MTAPDRSREEADKESAKGVLFDWMEALPDTNTTNIQDDAYASLIDAVAAYGLRVRAEAMEEMRERAAKATCYLCNQLFPVKRNDFTFYHEGLGICQASAIRSLSQQEDGK